MSTYSIKNITVDSFTFNKNKRHKAIVSRPVTEHIITATENNEIGRNNILFKNSVKSTNQLKPDNNFVSNQHYPFNTAVLFNYEIPYLSIEEQRKAEFFADPEDYYTFPKSTQNSIYFRSRYEKIVRSRPVGDKDASENYIQDIIAYLTVPQLISQESLEVQSPQFSAQAGDQLQYYYYRSMNGTCPRCVLEGGDFGLRLGITYPNDDGPLGNEQGYPLVGASSCEELNEWISMEPQVGGAEIIVGYPIDWTITYKDGTVISGIGCENVPDDFQDASSQILVGLSEEECAGLSALYPNIDISFNMYDVELITSETAPSSPVGEPCSDLFVKFV